MNRDYTGIVLTVAGLFFVCLFVGGACYGIPQYRIYSQTMQGKADLRQADWDRQIRVAEQRANLEAAQYAAQTALTQAQGAANADTARARGVADANRIIGESLTGEAGERYLRFKYVEALATGQGERVYIPTEAGLPLLEARPR